jgi:hypothetical protein
MLDLNQFYGGSSQFYQHTVLGTKLGVYTNGVKYIADECEAYWLIDLIMSYQDIEFPAKYPFQVWTLKGDGKSGAIAECEDGDGNHILTQNIGFTDFPFNEVENGTITMWFTDRTLLLPCEW